MRRRQARLLGGDETDESAYAAMTDMMVGVLFIFIILLGVFAAQARSGAQAPTLAGAAADANAALRASLTREVDADLRALRIVTPTAPRAGVLSFSADRLFLPQSAALSAEGRRTARALAAGLERRTACHAWGAAGVPACAGGRLSAIQVIGQAGIDPSTSAGRAAAALSLERASACGRALEAARPKLAELRDRPAAMAGAGPLLHVSAFSVGSAATPRSGGGQAIAVQLVTAD